MRALAPLAPVLALARNASLRSAACNVTIGDLMSQRLLKCGVRADRIEMISNWCNDETIRPQPVDDNPLRLVWGLQDKFVLGYSGNLGRAHEYETLLDAAELLKGEPDIVFLFIGGGHKVEKLRADAERLGLAGAFRFRPYQDASLLPQSLTLPDAHWLSLLPAMEGLIVPSKFFGIAAAGRATLAVTDPAGEIAGLLARHDCGVTVAPGAGKAMAAAILEMKRHPDRLARMGENARAMLDQLFTKQRAFAHWERVLANTGHGRA